MTPQEFKAWFDGFTEAVPDAPTNEQWKRIKERVSEIDGRLITERVFIDRWNQYSPHWWPYSPTKFVAGCNSGQALYNGVGHNMNSAMMANSQQALNFSEQLFALGRAEAAALNAA